MINAKTIGFTIAFAIVGTLAFNNRLITAELMPSIAGPDETGY